MLLARRIEQRFSKQEILHLYLNQIYFGSGAYGIAEAARTYFGKEIGAVDVGEAALLAGLPKAPTRFSPYRNPQRAEERRRYVLARLRRPRHDRRRDADRRHRAPAGAATPAGVRGLRPGRLLHRGGAPRAVREPRRRARAARRARDRDHPRPRPPAQRRRRRCAAGSSPSTGARATAAPCAASPPPRSRTRWRGSPRRTASLRRGGRDAAAAPGSARSSPSSPASTSARTSPASPSRRACAPSCAWRTSPGHGPSTRAARPGRSRRSRRRFQVGDVVRLARFLPGGQGGRARRRARGSPSTRSRRCRARCSPSTSRPARCWPSSAATTTRRASSTARCRRSASPARRSSPSSTPPPSAAAGRRPRSCRTGPS